MFGLIASVVALSAYVFTSTRCAFPGRSADFLAEFTPLGFALDPKYPLWRAIGRVIAAAAGTHLVLALNFFSVLCGAGCVWLFYEIVTEAVRRTIDRRTTAAPKVLGAARLAGATAAGMMAFSIPFWMISNRADPLTLGLLLLLLDVWLCLRYVSFGKQAILVLCGFLCGVGIVEFASFLIFAPLIVLLLGYGLWRHDDLRPGPILALALGIALGTAFYFVAAWLFYTSPGYEYLGYRSYFDIMWLLVRDQFNFLRRGLPKVGWLVVLFTTALPWITAMIIGRRALNRENSWSFHILHAILLLLAVGVFFNVPFSPWALLRESHFLATPYVLSAAVAGYCMAYFYLFLGGVRVVESSRQSRASRGRPHSREAAQVFFSYALPVATAALVGFGVWRNFPAADARPARGVHMYARQVIASLGGRTWLVTTGWLDSQLKIAAAELSAPIRILSLNLEQNPQYLKYVATLFEERRLRNLAGVGLMPLLNTWLRDDPEVQNKVAILAIPDFWQAAGLTWVPMKTMFFGVRDRSSIDPEALLAEHEQFWTEIKPELERNVPEGSYLDAMQRTLVRHTSLVANDLGVLMEDLGRTNEAFRCYQQACAIEPKNLSALINLDAMLSAGHASPDTEAIREKLKTLSSEGPSAENVWSLAPQYGYVRSPQAYASLGQIWAMSGQPMLGFGGYRQAADMLPEKDAASGQALMAAAYFWQDEDLSSEEMYKRILDEDSKSQNGLFGMLRIALKRGQAAEAADWLGKAEAAGIPGSKLAEERVMLNLISGEFDVARKMAENMVELDSSSLRARVLLAEVLIRQQDDASLQECFERLEQMEKGAAVLPLLKGAASLESGDLEGAVSHLEDALGATPHSVPLLSKVALIDLKQGRMDSAASRARELLRSNPENPLGNYILGRWQMDEKQSELAEDSLRRSLKVEKSLGALNDLAWLLQGQGRLDEAESLARQAVEMGDKVFQAWDTLGVILMQQDRLDEAEGALKRGVSADETDTNVLFHMAELKAKKGLKDEAAELIKLVSEKRDKLPPEDDARFDEVQAMIQAM